MKTLFVSLTKRTVVSADGRQLSVYPTLIEQKGALVRLNDCKDFAVDAIELVAVKQALIQWSMRLKLSALLQDGVVYFLNNQHARCDLAFDCYAFVNRVSGVVRHDKARGLEFWRLSPYPHRPKAGDVAFFLSRDARQFHHAAVHIGMGLYISVYGAGGDLEISTLRDIRRDFGAQLILLATPRT